jgi:hypothetical protein
VTTIPPSEIRFETASTVDTIGRVFYWNGGVYRAIHREHAEFVRNLIHHPNIDRLYDAGLVRTQVAPLRLEGYHLVLKHHRIPVVSYAMEWTAEMLRDAALMICDLGAEVLKFGGQLHDAHPWNVLFDHGRPVFVDLGSVSPYDAGAEWFYAEFRGRFILPLQLMAAGEARLARLLFFDTTSLPAARDVLRLTVKRLPAGYLVHWLRANRKLLEMAREPSEAFFAQLREAITSIPVAAARTEWSAYEGPDHRFSHDAPEHWQARTRNIDHLLDELKPETVMDIGCNRGWFSELATRHGAHVVAADIDEPSLNVVYQHARARGLPILPTFLDVCMPTPQYGLADGYASAQTRFESDLVLMLSVAHHLVFKRGLSFDAIARQLNGFTRRSLIVEFIPADDIHVRPWIRNGHEWYTLENFATELRSYFGRIEVLPSTPASRVLVHCRR